MNNFVAIMYYISFSHRQWGLERSCNNYTILLLSHCWWFTCRVFRQDRMSLDDLLHKAMSVDMSVRRPSCLHICSKHGLLQISVFSISSKSPTYPILHTYIQLYRNAPGLKHLGVLSIAPASTGMSKVCWLQALPEFSYWHGTVLFVCYFHRYK